MLATLSARTRSSAFESATPWRMRPQEPHKVIPKEGHGCGPFWLSGGSGFRFLLVPHVFATTTWRLLPAPPRSPHIVGNITRQACVQKNLPRLCCVSIFAGGLVSCDERPADLLHGQGPTAARPPILSQCPGAGSGPPWPTVLPPAPRWPYGWSWLANPNASLPIVHCPRTYAGRLL